MGVITSKHFNRKVNKSWIKILTAISLFNLTIAHAEVNDYLLFESPGLTARSTFSSHGDAWCKHVYVGIMVDYKDLESKKQLLQPNYAGFIENKMVSKIKAICPGFPKLAPYSRQIINLQVREQGKEMARERLNFKVLDDDSIVLIDDLAAKNWRKWNQDHTPIKPNPAQVKTTFVPSNKTSTQSLSLKDPSGMYLVSFNGNIVRLSATKNSKQDGIVSIEGHQLRDGHRTLTGNWYSDYQQFLMRGWVKMPGNERCNQLSERRWSNKFQSAEYTLPNSSRQITIYEETSEHPKNRKPRVCINAKLNPNTCVMESCNRYLTPPGRFVLVESKQDALEISPIMKNRFKKDCQLVNKSTWLKSVCPR